MKKLFILVFIVSSLQANSQAPLTFMRESSAFMNYADGRPMYMQVNYNIEGTPFFPDDYRFSTIYTPAGIAYQHVRAKINLLENAILYKTLEGEEMVANTPINGILFTHLVDGVPMNILFRKGYKSIDKQNETSFYQVLDTGSVSLLKFHRVTYKDEKKYGNASITRVFSSRELYYLCLPGNQLVKLEKGKDALIAAFPSKQDLVSNFINQQKLSCKSEADWKKVLRYYNSLP